ncbi:MAG: SHOCT domain-containing protein [Opitutales bacterium]
MTPDCIIPNWYDADGLIENKSSAVSPHDGFDAASEIEKLASLREKGVISEKEFDKKKKQLLGL